MYTLAYSKVVRSDVRSSYTYIKEKLESPTAAENLIIELINKLNCLKETLLTRPVVQDGYLASFEYRSIKVKNYVLYYIVDEGKNKVNIKIFVHFPIDKLTTGGCFTAASRNTVPMNPKKFITAWQPTPCLCASPVSASHLPPQTVSPPCPQCA